MRTLCSVLCTLLATAACGDLAPPAIEQGVSVSPRQLDFGELFVGQSRALEVEIINRGLRPLEVVAQTAPPFSLETHRFEILAGESRRLRVELQAVVVGSVARTLHLTAGSEVIAVDLVAHSAAAPACGAPGPCRFSSFDPVSGQCTTANLVDDTPCSQGCVRFGKCRAGQCVGTPVTCDDRNVCTIDSCNENGSCTHAPITCPESDDPCTGARVRLGLPRHHGSPGQFLLAGVAALYAVAMHVGRNARFGRSPRANEIPGSARAHAPSLVARL